MVDEDDDEADDDEGAFGTICKLEKRKRLFLSDPIETISTFHFFLVNPYLFVFIFAGTNFSLPWMEIGCIL